MNPPDTHILIMNGGSSSIRFALYRVGTALGRGLHGMIDRIGLDGTTLTSHGPAAEVRESRTLGRTISADGGRTSGLEAGQ